MITLPSAPKLSSETTATYGAMSPFLVRRGDGTLHKERRSVRQHGRDHTGNFTQVRAVVRRKTLLLLWCIDGGKMVVDVVHLPGKVALGRKWLRAYECGRVRTLPTVAMGLLL